MECCGPIGATNRRLGYLIPALVLAVLATTPGVRAAEEGDRAPSKKSPSSAPVAEANPLGDPLAAGKVNLALQEMVAGLKQRGMDGEFAKFCRYAGGRLDASAGRYTGSELTGNCRLRWYDHLLRNPLKAIAESEQFTRDIHRDVLAGPERCADLLATVRQKLDLPAKEGPRFAKVRSGQESLDVVKRGLIESQVAYAAALAPLSKSEIEELSSYLYPVLVTQNNVGHTLTDRGTGRRLCDLLEKMDRGAMQSAAEALAPLLDPELLRQLGTISDRESVRIEGVGGQVVRVENTPAGAILIGGRGKNSYRLDEMRGVCCVIDLGGDDEYIEGSVSVSRPLLVVIDLKGNDAYRGSRPGIQGSSVLGVSMLVDVEGNDQYLAQNVAQGSALGGVGILVDFAGDDIYRGVMRVQAQAIGGFGLLIDRDGQDRYRAGMWAQGFAGPLGFALLDDVAGNDHYFAGGLFRDSYPETPGMEGWSQGVGAGIRQVANGGVGMLLDGEGDDLYEFDYISHGGGYWCGLGFFRDFSGDDRHLGSTSANLNGSARTESQFQRFGCGFGCHYSLGFCFDDSGDDEYRGNIMGLGMGWDCSAGALCDFAGNDHYDASGSTTQGAGAQGSLGLLFDYDGNDVHEGYGQGYASSGVDYHPPSQCGGNFSFLVDYGGNDEYGCGARNNSYNQRGTAGGFLIDRPSNEETAESEEPPSPVKPAHASL